MLNAGLVSVFTDWRQEKVEQMEALGITIKSTVGISIWHQMVNYKQKI